MSEQNIVHASDFGNYTDNVVNTIKIGDVDVDVRYTISINEALEFSNSVVNLCYADKDSAYSPEIKDFAIRANLVSRYTNIELPESIEDKYMFLYTTDVFDVIRREVNPRQLRSIIYGIDERIEYMNNTIMSGVYKEFMSIVSDMEKLSGIMNDMFGGIDKDTLGAVASSLADGNFDETKFAGEVFKLIQDSKVDSE